MNRDDLDIVKNILDEIESSRNLTKEEKNLLDRIDSIIEFDNIQAKYNQQRKAFDEKMKALSEKAGE